MDFAWIVPILFMITLLGVMVFAMASKTAVMDRMDDPRVPKSTLAKDGPQGGVGFLLPPDERERRGVRNVAPVLE